MKKLIYYCEECKKIMNSVEDVYFVEQKRYRCFCSEKCIIDFFGTMIRYFEEEEASLRKELNLQENFDLEFNQYEEIIKNNITLPDEIWVESEDLSEEICYYLSKIPGEQPFFLVMATLVFESGPSFVLLEVITRSEELVERYRRGLNVKRADQPMPFSSSASPLMPSHSGAQDPLAADPELINYLEGKKSEIFSELLELRSSSDIPLEDFEQYGDLLADTMESPDEVYQMNRGNDLFYTYIKGQTKNGHSIFYLVVCLDSSALTEDDHEAVIPILSFPTYDANLCRHFKQGKRIEGRAIS